MESRVAIIGIIVENMEATERLNAILHEYAPYVIGRMGIISVAVDAPEELISALAGKIGRLEGVSAKTAYSNFCTKDDE